MTAHCKHCGSDKIIPNVPLQDHYGEYGGFADTAKVNVHGEPSAWIFKDSAHGRVSLHICGECGHAELFVDNFRELYEKHQQAQGGQVS